MLLEAHGDYARAAMKYTQAIWDNPKDADAYVRRGRLYDKKGLYHKALVDFTQAVKYMPSGENYYNRGQLYHKLGMEEQAYSDFKKTVELEYKTEMPARNIYFNSGMLFKDKGRGKEAAADFSSAIDADPSFAQAYLERAEIYLDQGLYKESLLDFNRALKYAHGTDVDLRDVVAGQGMAFYKAGMLDHALASALKLIAIVPSLTVHFNEKNALDIFDAGKLNSILRSVEEVAEKAEGKKSWKEAFRTYEAGLSWVTSYTDRETAARFLKGLKRVYPMLKEKPPVPEEGRRYEELAETLTEKKLYGKAINAYGRLIQFSPWLPEAYFNMAMLHAELGEYKKAADNMKQYLELAPDAPDAPAAHDRLTKWEALMKGG